MPSTIALRRAVETAGWALREHATSALFITIAGATAVAAALPVVSLGGPGSTRLHLAPRPEADLGITLSSLASTPADVQQRAIIILSAMLLGLAAAVLVVGVMAVLALAAARTAARRSEVAVRRAVGASPRQLLAAAVVEGALLAAAAVGVGAAVGIAGARGARAAWPGPVGAGGTTAAASVVLGLAAIVVLGVVAPMVSRRQARRAVSVGALPHGLVVPTVQLGISLAILVAAAQLTRHASGLLTQTGVATDHDGRIFQVSAHSPRGERAARYTSLLKQLRADRTIGVASLTSPGALAGLGTVDLVITDCGNCAQGGLAFPLHPIPATLSAVSSDTFGAIGIRVVRGRGIVDTDGWDGPRVAVVNRALAARHFERGEAVGRRILIDRSAEDGWYTVVGVVEAPEPAGFGGALQSPYRIYLSALQSAPHTVDLLVRPRAPRVTVAGAGRVVGAALRGSGTVVQVMSESERFAAETALVRWFERLLWLEGFAALAIAILGTFAVMRLWVAALVPELAVRRAVGARRRRALGYVLRGAVTVGIAGTAFGVWLVALTSDAFTAVFAGLPGPDLGLVLRPSLALMAAAVAGAVLPAWRAVTADPATIIAANSP